MGDAATSLGLGIGDLFLQAGLEESLEAACLCTTNPLLVCLLPGSCGGTASASLSALFMRNLFIVSQTKAVECTLCRIIRACSFATA